MSDTEEEGYQQRYAKAGCACDPYAGNRCRDCTQDLLAQLDGLNMHERAKVDVKRVLGQ